MSDTQVTPEDRKRRKVREGLVVSTSMEKTVVVAVTERVAILAISKLSNKPKSSTPTTNKTMLAPVTGCG